MNLSRHSRKKDLRALLESALLSSAPQVEPADTEGDFLAIYRRDELAAQTPVIAAVQGGRRADRLAWVFISGYQAVIRSVFPEVTTSGWAAFAAAEDARDPERYPPASVTRGNGATRISGCKSWVAQSRSVEQLVVTVGPRQDGRCFLIQARDGGSLLPGVELDHRPELKENGERRFLADMSQGFARLDQIPSVGEFAGERIRCFVRREPAFVMLSCLGFIARDLSPGRRQAAARLAVELAGEVGGDPGDLPDPSVMVALDDRFQGLITDLGDGPSEHGRLEQPSLLANSPGFSADRPLLSLYSKALQKRAQR